MMLANDGDELAGMVTRMVIADPASSFAARLADGVKKAERPRSGEAVDVLILDHRRSRGGRRGAADERALR